MDGNSKLNPCPFCGCTQINVNPPAGSFGAVEFICTGCPAIVRFVRKTALRDASGCWNRRDFDAVLTGNGLSDVTHWMPLPPPPGK